MISYSGFATKQQETFYTKLLEKAVSLTTNKVIELIKFNPEIFNANKESDLKFIKHIRKIFKYMSQMENQKLNEHKFAEHLEPLYNYFKENFEIQSDILSQTNSDQSLFKNFGIHKMMPSYTSQGTDSKNGKNNYLDQINESTTSNQSNSRSYNASPSTMTKRKTRPQRQEYMDRINPNTEGNSKNTSKQRSKASIGKDCKQALNSVRTGKSSNNEKWAHQKKDNHVTST